jgi:AraC family transcriptional regulator
MQKGTYHIAMDYIDTLNESVRYIEIHLEDALTYADVAEHVAISPYHFMRIWKSVTGLTLAEYIRDRELYQAILDLSSDPSLKIIDVAYKYHYGTPASFSKAFARLMGVSPKEARKDHSKIKPFLPLAVSSLIQGGHKMDYQIVEMKEFAIIGVDRRFGFDDAYGKIPAFWSETIKTICQPDYSHFDLVKKARIGEYGVCVNDGSEDFDYLIAGEYHNEKVPDGFKTRKIPAGLWAKFKCVGPLPGSMQSVNTMIWHEWLPSHPEYELSENIDIEFYSDMPMDDPHYQSEIWIPIKKRQA